MTREEAIAWCDRFNNAWANADPEDDFPDVKYSDALDQLFYLAGKALRQQDVSEKYVMSEPLTLNNLKSSVKFGYPVWLVGMEDGDGWVFIHHVDSLSVRYSRVGDSKEWCFRTKSYGVRVFAYLDGPKEEQHDID